MDDLRHLLFDRGRVKRTLELLEKNGWPDPTTDPERTLIHGHALNLYGAYGRALRLFTSIPSSPRYDAERFWGQSSYYIRIGALHQAKRLLDRAFSCHPPIWLLPQLYNNLATYYNQLGRFDDSIKANQQGLEEAERSGNMIQHLMLTGNLSITGAIRGDPSQSLTVLERVVRQLLERDSVLASAHFLIVQADIYNLMGMASHARRCLQRAEKLLEESGSVGRMVLLKLEMGAQLSRQGSTSREMDCYHQALDLLRDIPDPLLENQVYTNISLVHFRKGDFSQALGLIDRLLADARSKNLAPQALASLSLKGRYLIGAGAAKEGIAVLEEARDLAERLDINQFLSVVSLHLCLGWLKLGRQSTALDCLRLALSTSAQSGQVAALLSEPEDLETSLRTLAGQLTVDPFLSRLIVSLRNHKLLRQLLRYDPPHGKLMFLRSLSVHDSGPLRATISSLSRDHDPKVRSTARALLASWERHTSYRVSVLGPMRVFIEDRLLPENSWVRAGVRRLFLFLLLNRGRWMTYEQVLETIWRHPDPEAARKVLANRLSELRRIIEPWHLPGRPFLLLQSRPGACGLFGQDRIWVDAEEFSTLIRRAEDAHSRRCFREARGCYRRALDLYAGDLLEEYPYEDWLESKRTALRLQYFRSSARYAAMSREAGNLPEARRALEEAMLRDAGCGECLRLLIEILCQMGLYRQARDWAQRHTDFLKRELGLSPDPEVQQAIARLEGRF